jgi:hypothetical protein
MRELTEKEIDEVAGGVIPAVIGVLHIVSKPGVLSGLKFAGKAFIGGAFGGAGWETTKYLHAQIKK